MQIFDVDKYNLKIMKFLILQVNFINNILNNKFSLLSVFHMIGTLIFLNILDLLLMVEKEFSFSHWFNR